MLRTFSYVESGWFYQPMTGADPIIVETPAWFDWLEHHSAFTFVDPVGTFADLPGLAPVLAELRKRRKANRAVDHKPGAYLQSILAAMSPMAAHTLSSDELLRREGLEPLTGRELHILSLLDRELTNKEIVRELVVTPGTVKVHTNNLYRKLSVNNRRAAVTLAKAFGLLGANQASRIQLI
jgi:DNA-binding CsgD family transcriptional regulator